MVCLKIRIKAIPSFTVTKLPLFTKYNQEFPNLYKKRNKKINFVYIFSKRQTVKRGKSMDYGVIAIVAICVLVLVIGVLKQKAKLVFQFFARAAVGLVCIYFCNEFLAMQHISVSVGLNPVSFLTVGALGFGGFALLYGIMFYQLL